MSDDHTLRRMSARHVLDGCSDRPFSGHVLVAGERIVDVVRSGPEGAVPAGLDDVPEMVSIAAGSLLAPGFVDVHAHSDLGVLHSPTAPSKIAQGVTTEVVGNCGFSAFPEPSYWVEPTGKHGDLTCFDDAGGYLAAVAARGRPSNVATLVGAGSVRARVVGSSSARAATTSELNRMRGAVSEAMAAGAVGLSMGLMFAPGCYASHAEHVALATTARRAGGRVLAVHMRDEGSGLLQSLRECIGIARAADIPLHVSHVKAKGRRAWGMVSRFVDAIRDADHPISFDFYPYTASMSTISSLVPPAVQASLADPARPRPSLREAGSAIAQYAAERDGSDTWRAVTIAHAPGFAELVGLNIERAAAVAGTEPPDLVVDLWIRSEGRAEIINHCMSQSDVDELASLPEAMIASDGYALHAGDGPPAHPRSFGTFPHFLRRYVVEQRHVSWPEAVRRMTSGPARIFGLADVGALAPGRRADLVVLDPATVGSPATYDQPRRLATGVTHQVVGGRLVSYIDTKVREPAGRALRGGHHAR